MKKILLLVAILLLSPIVVSAQTSPAPVNDCTQSCDPDIIAPSSPPPGSAVVLDRSKPFNQTGLGNASSATVQTGGAATVQGSSSYTYSVPLFSKPGRAGMDLNLTLYYNSHLWVPDAGGMLMGFDRNTPAPGFQLNFGFVEWSPAAGGPAGIVSTADGGKHTLSIDVTNLVYDSQYNVYRCANLACLYDSDDSSYIHVVRPLGTFDGSVCTGPNNCPAKDITVISKNGMQATYQSFAVVTNDLMDELVMRPYRIQDTNGNYATISYLNANDLNISSITDSVGRTLNFFYNSVQVPLGQGSQTVPLLTCVTDGASCNAPGARTYTFTYDQTHSISTNFTQANQMLVNGNLFGVSNGFTLPVLTKVCRPDSTCVQFNYGDWGIVNDIQELSSSGLVRYELSYDFPASSGGPLSANPTYSHQSETIYQNQSLSGVTNTWILSNTFEADGLITSSSINDPIGTVTTTTFSRAGDWRDGLPIQIQTSTGGTCTSCPPGSLMPTPAPQVMLTRNLEWASDLSEAQSGITNGGDNTGKNPRLASITTVLDDGSQSKVSMQYDNSVRPVASGAPAPFTGSGSVIDKTETDLGTTAPGPVLRETITTYKSLGNHILGLPTDVAIKDGTGKVVSHTKYTYDDTALQTVSSPPVVGHDNVNYSSTSATPRGNLTTSTIYADPVNNLGGVTSTFMYDMLGNRVGATTGCCTQMAWNYSSVTQYAYPDSVSVGPSGNQLSTSFTYDQNTGQILTATDANGQKTIYGHDPSGRPTTVQTPDNVTITTSYDDTNRNRGITRSTNANSLVTVHTTDFLGRTVADQVQNGTASISTVSYGNDFKGRPVRISNPFGPQDTPVYTTNEYDALGRITAVTPPAATSGGTQINYATSITGATTVFTDPAGVQRKEIRDGLGRLVQVQQPGPSHGAIASGSVTISGTEQTASVASGGGATPGTGSVTISGAENSTQVLVTAAQSATGSVTISGSERSQIIPGKTTCVPKLGCTTSDPTINYDSGTCTITVGSHAPYSYTFGQNDSSSLNIANGLAGVINQDTAKYVTATVTTNSTGSVVNLTAGAAGSSGNVALSSSCSSPLNSYSTPSNSGAMAGGADAVFRTEYNTGTVSITVTTTVNGASTNASKTYTYGQNDDVNSVASGLASLMHQDTTFPVDGSPAGSLIKLTTRSTGSGTGYPVSVSATTTDQYFSASAFTAASAANLTSGQNGVIPDAGTLTLSVKNQNVTLYSQSVNYDVGSTPATLANALVLAINGSSNSPVTATVSSGSAVINLTAKALGASGNFTLAGSSATTQGAYFTQPSFTASSGSLTGGTDPIFSLQTPITTAYTYDPMGNILQINKDQQVQTYVYDGLGRLTSAATPETANQPVTYAYTDFGAVSQKTDPRVVPGTSTHITTTYSYDALNRVKTITYNDNVTPGVTYTYNSPVAPNNTGGRLARISNSVEQKDYQYDVMGRITQCVHTIGTRTYTVGYGYNADGQFGSITYPSQLKVTYGYDPIGRLQQISEQPSGGASQTILNINPADYNAAGLARVVTYGNNVTGTFGFNNRLQISSIQYGAPSPAAPLLSLGYSYGGAANNGQIQGVTDNLDPTRSTSYAYNKLGQLQMAQTVNQTSPNSWQLNFTYDNYGNRLAETPTGGSAPMPSNEVIVDPATSRIQGLPYDAAGNMLGDGLNYYVFDAMNRLTSSSPVPGMVGASTTFGFGPDGDLVNKNGTYYIYAAGQPIAEYPGGAAAGSPSIQYVNQGGSQIANISAGGITFNYPDHLSTRVIADMSGKSVGTFGHFPAGEPLYQTGVSSDFQFTSYRRDVNSGLDYANARFYDARIGRFMSADPLLGNNRFAYAGSDPVNTVDPSGLFGICIGNACGPDCSFFCVLGGPGGGGGSSLGCALCGEVLGLPAGMQIQPRTLDELLKDALGIPDICNPLIPDYCGLGNPTDNVAESFAQGGGHCCRQDLPGIHMDYSEDYNVNARSACLDYYGKLNVDINAANALEIEGNQRLKNTGGWGITVAGSTAGALLSGLKIASKLVGGVVGFGVGVAIPAAYAISNSAPYLYKANQLRKRGLKDVADRCLTQYPYNWDGEHGPRLIFTPKGPSQ